ncbi:WecB/TagA/CpsF family glycosyltransferase [Spirochaeta dissipatitropha]
MENYRSESGTAIVKYLLAGLPVHHVSREALAEAVSELRQKNSSQRIVFLRNSDLVLSWLYPPRRKQLETAALVLPLQKGVVRAARIAGIPELDRHMPFQLVVQILGAVEEKQGSLYMIGGRPFALEKAEANIRFTFPKLKLVGRFQGYFRKKVEPSLLTAARKANPDVLLLGSGLRGGDRWLTNHLDDLPPSICISAPGVFRIFAEQKRRPSRRLFHSGTLENLGAVFLPWRWLLLPLYIVLGFRLLIERHQRKKGNL